MRLIRFAERQYLTDKTNSPILVEPGVDYYCLTNSARQWQGLWTEELTGWDRSSIEPGQGRPIILNGLGGGWGDILVGQPLLAYLHERHGLPVDLLTREELATRVATVCGREPGIGRIYEGLIPLAEMQGRRAVVDLESLLQDPEFPEEHLLDSYFRRAGICLDEVPLERRVPRARICPAADARLREAMESIRSGADRNAEARGHPWCVLNVHGSWPRCMPEELWLPCAEELVRAGFNLAVVAGAAERATTERILGTDLPRPLAARVINLSGLSSVGWEALVGIVRHLADVVVSTDTSVLHVAGAEGKPVVGIMFTIEPDLRLRYYRRAAGYVHPDWRSAPWWGASKIDGQGLCEEADLRAAWKRADFGAVAGLACEAYAGVKFFQVPEGEDDK